MGTEAKEEQRDMFDHRLGSIQKEDMNRCSFPTQKHVWQRSPISKPPERTILLLSFFPELFPDPFVTFDRSIFKGSIASWSSTYRKHRDMYEPVDVITGLLCATHQVKPACLLLNATRGDRALVEKQHWRMYNGGCHSMKQPSKQHWCRLYLD